jgi:protein TonB
MDENWLKTRKYVKPKIDFISISLAYPPAEKPSPQPQKRTFLPVKRLLPAPRPAIKKKIQPDTPIIRKPKIATPKKTKLTEPKLAEPPEKILHSLERFYSDEPDTLSKSIFSNPPGPSLKSPPGDLPDYITDSIQEESPEIPLKEIPEEKSGTDQTAAIGPEHPPAAPPTSEIIKEAIPLYQENPAPQYPRLAKRRGYQGTVVLDVLVTKAGKVAEVEVVQSSHYSLLDKAAVSAVKKWRFKPGERGHKKVDMRVRVPIHFQVKNW